MAHFYLYSCSRYVYRYLSGRMIACLEVLASGYRAPALAHMEQSFLCITARQLNRESRLAGGALDASTQDFPLTVRFNIPPKLAKSIPVYLVKRVRNKIKCEFTTLNRYNTKTQNHICAFVVGELPFSLVDGFLFDTPDDRVNFERPLPDLWYPEDLYGAIDHECFVEDLPVSVSEIQHALRDAVAGCSEIEEAVAAVRMRERVRAALYGAILKTAWKSNRYSFNMDSVLQEHFGLSDAELEAAIPRYGSMKSERYRETIPLFQFGQKGPGVQGPDSERSLDEALYVLLLDQFSKYSTYAEKGEELWQSVLDAIVDREDLPEYAMLCDVCDRLKASLRNEPDCDLPDELSKRLIGTDCSVLLAFLFVARNVNNLQKLSGDLKEYKVDPVTIRRAFLLWFFLNAMYDVPGKNALKDNAALWQHIECYVSSLFRSDMLYTIQQEKPVTVGKDRKLLGISLYRDPIVMKSDMISFFQEWLLQRPAEVIPYCASLLPREKKGRTGMRELDIAEAQTKKRTALLQADSPSCFSTRYIPTTPEKIRSMIEENLDGWAAAYRSYWSKHDPR